MIANDKHTDIVRRQTSFWVVIAVAIVTASLIARKSASTAEQKHTADSIYTIYAVDPAGDK